jgi:ribosomal protein L7/L12
MTSNDVYERLGILEQLVKNLYEKTGVPLPNLQALSRTEVSPAVQQLAASGKLIEAIKVYRAETGVDLATAKRIVESL